MDDALQANRLSEALLEHSTACQWVLAPELKFVRVYGKPEPLLPVPQAGVETWREKAAAAFSGQAVSWRETRGTRIFQVNLFPIPSGRAGGFGFELTPWSDAERQLRDTALEVLRARESERARWARLLHDEVGQSMSAAGLHLDLLRMDLESQVPGISARTAEIQQVLETVMQRVRDLSNELNPSAAERVGLYPALDRLVGRVRKDFAGSVRLMADSTLRLTGPIAAAMYKIANDAVENALRAASTRIEILVKNTREGATLEVRDNGKSFDPGEPAASASGLALLVMEQHAAQAGLRFSVSSRRGQGTVVKAIYNKE